MQSAQGLNGASSSQWAAKNFNGAPSERYLIAYICLYHKNAADAYMAEFYIPGSTKTDIRRNSRILACSQAKLDFLVT